MLVEGSEHPQPGKSGFFHPGGPAAGQGVGNQGDAVGPPGLMDAFYDALGLFRHGHLFIVSVTGGTVIAPGRSIFPKVVEEGLAEAAGGPAVMLHGIELPEIGFFHFFQHFILLLVFQEEFLDHHILGREQQDAFRGLSVPASPARFLVVVFQTGGHVVVEYEAHVGLVDAHAEGVGGDDHRGPVVLEILLGLLALLLAHPCMVPGSRDPFQPEPVAQFIHVLPGGTVDDAAVFRMILQIPEHPGVLVPGMFYPEIQIAPVEAGDQDLGIPQFQALEDVIPDLLRGRGGKGSHHRSCRQEFQEIQDPGVAGPEILSPLGNTVSFVHCHHGNGSLFGEIPEQFRLQPFRGHVDQLVGTGPGLVQGGVEFPSGQGTVDVSGLDPGGFQSLDLVLHQGDQGRNYQGDPGEQQGGDLVAQGFAGAGGHDAQHVPALEQGINQGFLTGAEGSVSKILFQCR